MSFMLRKVGTEQYVHSDIDGGGMSVVLSTKEHADRFDTKPVADSLKRRVAERYSDTQLEVVSC